MPSGAQKEPVAPADGAAINLATLKTLTWQASEDPDGQPIAEYHVQVSPREDMLHPVSPNLDRLTFSGKPEWAARAAAEGADYIGVGPVYPTGSKADARAAIGPEGLAEVLAHAPGLPAAGIGGVAADNLDPVIGAGARGVAVIGAVMGAADPEAAARELRRRIEEARR